MTDLREIRGGDGQTEGPSSSLRFAQDDKFLGNEKANAGPFDEVRASSAITPLAMELREVAMRMTHLYWYWSGCPFADEGSSNRMASLLYVDTN